MSLVTNREGTTRVREVGAILSLTTQSSPTTNEVQIAGLPNANQVKMKAKNRWTMKASQLWQNARESHLLDGLFLVVRDTCHSHTQPFSLGLLGDKNDNEEFSHESWGDYLLFCEHLSLYSWKDHICVFGTFILQNHGAARRAWGSQHLGRRLFVELFCPGSIIILESSLAEAYITFKFSRTSLWRGSSICMVENGELFISKRKAKCCQ